MKYYEWSSLLLLLLSSALVWLIYKRQTLVIDPARAFLSPITYFALLWWVAYPLHAFLLQWGLVDTQQKTKVFESDLLLSVLLSGAFMGMILLGAERYQSSRSRPGYQAYCRIHYLRASIVLLMTIAFALWFLKQTVFKDWQWHPFVGNTQNMMRVGGGPFFLLSILFIYAMLASIPLLVIPWWKKIGWPGWLLAILFFIGFGLAIAMMVALSSRRMLFVICFATFVAVMMRLKRPPMILAVVVIISTILSASVMQMMRYIGNPDIHGQQVETQEVHVPDNQPPGIHIPRVDYLTVCNVDSGISPQRSIMIYADKGVRRELGRIAKWLSDLECRRNNYFIYFTIQQIASTYGLADHLATYIHKAGWHDFVLGKDHGRAWLFNIILAYVPRAVWQTKPIQYGSVAIQKWLYPDMFDKQAVTMTLPPGFVVDFLYGFGIIPALIISYFLGKWLGFLRSILWGNEYVNAAVLAVSLCVMAYMFNLVRGGTGGVMSIYLIILMVVIIYRQMPWETANSMKCSKLANDG